MALSAAPFFLQSSASYSITNSLRLRSSNSARLSRTPGAPTNNLKWTFSTWVKRGTLGAVQTIIDGDDGASTNAMYVRFLSDDTIDVAQVATTYNLQAKTTAVFRDPNAWYHIVVVYDSPNATSTDRFQLWVNGVRQSLTYTTGPVAQNTVSQINLNTRPMYLGFLQYAGIQYLDGFLAETIMVDGQALTPSSFGQTSTTTGAWVPIRYTGTYGAQGWLLQWKDASAATAAAIGKDTSGNGNNWTPTGISVTAGVTFDQYTDTPTANTATYNPLLNYPSNPTTFSNANTRITRSGPSIGAAVSSIGATSGKFYGEFTLTTAGATAILWRVGVTGADNFYSSTYNIGGEFDAYGTNTNGVGYFGNGTRRSNGTDTASWGATYTTGDVIQVAFDASTGKVWFGKNNVWQASGDPAAGTSPAATLTTGVPFYFTHQILDSAVWDANFGGRAFTYTPPSGFVGLTVANLPTPSILKGNTYMDAVTRTGTGAVASVSSLAFQPDLVWIKSRSAATNHNLFDSTRGVQNGIVPNSTAAEYADANSLTAFNATGYSLGTDGGSRGININTNTYVDPSWKKGVTPGFDIVGYTGNATNRTISHALGAAPHFMIIRNRNAVTSWPCWHRNLTSAAFYLDLSTTAAQASDPPAFNSTAPTSSVFSVGTNTNTNGNTNGLVAYLWTSIPGFSLFGSYTGNGNADGPFVWCGFRPRFLLFKRADAIAQWLMLDSARSPTNGIAAVLVANSAGAETTDDGGNWGFDFVANGFKVRGINSDINTSTGTYVFAAFAENPFKYANAR